MGRILILEDDPNRMEKFHKRFKNDTVIHHDNAVGFIKEFDKDEKYDATFLDHDLGGETYVSSADQNTGSEVVRHMVQATKMDKGFADRFGIVVVHSLNVNEAPNMLHDLVQAGFDACRVPFTAMKF